MNACLPPARYRLVFLLTLFVACKSGADQPIRPISSQRSNPAAPAGVAKAATVSGDDLMDGCPGEKTACGEAKVADANANHFGAPFSDKAGEKLGALVARFEREKKAAKGERVKVSGQVASVCKKKGCWMVLQDGEFKARIFTKEHGFFLPLNIIGRHAEVEGALRSRVISERFAKHLKEDGGKTGDTVRGPHREWIMEATAVALR